MYTLWSEGIQPNRKTGRESKTREGKEGKRKREREKGRKEEGGGMDGWRERRRKLKNIFEHY